jgi:DNA/RNA-binding domain of Phe-tRNA-synthetase-like protein
MMKYSIAPFIFEKNPDVCFGIVIGKGLKNTDTLEADSQRLADSEGLVKSTIQPDTLKTTPAIAKYREALKNVDINGNKFMNSVEAMSKRVVKGGQLPRINALVDLCNAIALKYLISLGAHDLRDIHEDLSVRLSEDGDKFLPFGEEAYEDVAPGEVVFTSGNIIQTRQWLWRQSKLGMIDLDSSDIVFQLVGFKGDHYDNFENALKDVETLAKERFGAEVTTYVVDRDNPSIEF